MSVEGQSDSIVGEIENMVRSYIEKVIVFIDSYSCWSFWSLVDIVNCTSLCATLTVDFYLSFTLSFGGNLPLVICAHLRYNLAKNAVSIHNVNVELFFFAAKYHYSCCLPCQSGHCNL